MPRGLGRPGGPAPRSASTLTSSGAPAALAAAASRARSPGFRSGSRPTLLSPHTTRSGRLPASPNVAASLARKRGSTSSITPGWTSATRIVPAWAGAGRAAAYARVPASSASGTPSPTRYTARPALAGLGPAAAAARAPLGHGRGPDGRPDAAGHTRASGTTATATPTLTATSRKLTAQTPPTEASASTAGWFHWLVPSSPHGPPRPGQARTYSPATQALGTSSSAASTRPGPGRPCSSAQASQPHGSQQAPSTSASSGANGPTLLSTNESTAKKKPAPPSQAATAASRPLGAERTSTTSGARPKKASHHSEGRGKASASGAPSSTASPRRAQRPRRRRLAGGAAVTRSPASADSPRVGAAGGRPEASTSGCVAAASSSFPALRLYRFMATYLVSRYSSMPSSPPSRPKPDCLTPPNGAVGLETMPWLSPIMPFSRPSATRKARCRLLV